MYKKVLILLFFIPFQLLFAQKSMLKDFPEGSTPEEIGKRLVIRRLFIGMELCDMLILQKIRNLSIVCKISLNLCLPRKKRCNLL